MDLALRWYERDREAAGTVVGSALAFRLFLFFIPLLLFVVGLTGSRTTTSASSRRSQQRERQDSRAQGRPRHLADFGGRRSLGWLGLRSAAGGVEPITPGVGSAPVW